MRWFLILLLSVVVCYGATSYTEFYCDNGTAGTSNVFSGSTSSATPAYSTSNGNWDGTSVFTPTDGSTPASSVSAGDWASVCVDGAIMAVYVSRVVTVAAGVNGAITLHTTAVAGTAPSANATGRSIFVGGAWHGPGTRNQVGGQGGATNYFPFDFVTAVLTNTSQNPVRVNFKSGSVYICTNAITHSKAGPIRWQGYTNSVGDNGRAILGGNPAGSSYQLLAVTGVRNCIQDFIIRSNGASSGTLNGVAINGNNICRNVSFDSMGGSGVVGGGASDFIGCEATNCCTGGAANHGGFHGVNVDRFIQCTSHHNLSANANGFYLSGGSVVSIMINCISYSNTVGVLIPGTSSILDQCNIFGNTGDGVNISQASTAGPYEFENCLFFSNGGYGINSSGSSFRQGQILNCGFGLGAGAQNASGDLGPNITGPQSDMLVAGTLTYTSGQLPWVDAPSGNFAIVSGSTVRAAGLGYLGAVTTAFPDIGAAQSASTNSAGGSWTFSQ